MTAPMTGTAPPLRVVLTGGPGGGKTTAVDLYRRELGNRVVVVPESATMLFAGGLPRGNDNVGERAVQRAIYQVQHSLEEIQTANFPDRVLLCDRGTIDGAAYWPDHPDDYFLAMGTTMSAELRRYDAVLFFETAAVGGLEIEGGNRYRTESEWEAVELDRRLRLLWSQHPRFHLVTHDRSFLHKINAGLAVLQQVLNGAGRSGGP